MTVSLPRQVASEAIGTFCLLFVGTGAIIANDLHGEVVTHVGIAIAFGLVVLAMIYAIGDVSGAHINPAVTIAFTAAGRLPVASAAPFIGGQLAGAFAASGCLRLLFPEHATLGSTIPAGPLAQSFLLEVILSLILMFVILGVSTGAKEKGITAGIAVGAVITMEALFGGPVSGASMNPARSLAPAVLSGQLETVWIDLTAPVLGVLAAIPVCRCTRGADCCTTVEPAADDADEPACPPTEE